MNRISPERYKEILDGIELKRIILKSSKSLINHELIDEKMLISISDRAIPEINNNGFSVESRYSLNVKNSDKKQVIKIEAIYLLFFSSESKISEDFFEIYREISLPLIVWPFFREFVNSMTSRMNIPPLTLPLLKR